MTQDQTTTDTAVPEQPDGIDDDSYDLPDPTRAAERVDRFLQAYGDGIVGVEVAPEYQDGMPPLYARDLEALGRAARRGPTTADAPDVWDASVAPGGYVCATCGTPSESEPCREHQPAAYAEAVRSPADTEIRQAIAKVLWLREAGSAVPPQDVESQWARMLTIGPGDDPAGEWGGWAREADTVLAAKDAEIQRLREYADTTRHHPQKHAEAVREIERLRAELDRAHAEVNRQTDAAQAAGEDHTWATHQRAALWDVLKQMTRWKRSLFTSLEEADSEKCRLLERIDEARAQLADLRAKAESSATITIPRPHIPYGPVGKTADEADVEYLRKAARDLAERYRPFGSNLRATLVRLINDAADAIAARPAGESVAPRHWREGGWEDIAVAGRQFSSAYWAGAEADHLGSLAARLQQTIAGVLNGSESGDNPGEATVSRESLAELPEDWREQVHDVFYSGHSYDSTRALIVDLVAHWHIATARKLGLVEKPVRPAPSEEPGETR